VKNPIRRTGKFLASLLSAALLGSLSIGAIWSSASPQTPVKKGPQTAGVDDTKMGPYRALAQMTYAAFQKGDAATAAELARVLERVWDKAEDYGGDTALSKTNHKVFEDIDKAMDHFIAPLMESKGKAPDAAKVKAAYTAYVEKLSRGD